MILKEKYINYDQPLLFLNMDSLEARRATLCLKFAKSGIKHNKLDDLFPENKKKHKMNTRNMDKFKVEFLNTETLQHTKNANILKGRRKT